jgi:putative membrane protein
MISIAAGYVSVLWLLYRRWARTQIHLRENDIVILRNTFFMSQKIIPHNRIAAINADAGIINRIFKTVKLKVNINSSANAFASSATLTFSKDKAEEVFAKLSERSFGQTESLDSHASAIPFSNRNIILHGLFGISSYQTLTTLGLLGYSVSSSLFSETDPMGMAIAIGMAATITVIPLAFVVIKYLNFKVFRIGDVIYMQHGAMRTYRSSFDVSKINAVRIRTTLFTRLMGMAYIEAEVVGIDGSYRRRSKIRPMICMLSKRSVMQNFIDTMIPEFNYPRAPKRQPMRAAVPLMMKAAAISSAFVIVISTLSLIVFEILEEFGLDEELGVDLVSIVVLVVMIAAIASILWTLLSVRAKRFDAGDEMFTFMNGALDKDTVIMYYDKVQMAQIRSGPITRALGLARCKVSILATSGKRAVASGFFFVKELNVIPDMVIKNTKKLRSDRPNDLT